MESLFLSHLNKPNLITNLTAALASPRNGILNQLAQSFLINTCEAVCLLDPAFP